MQSNANIFSTIMKKTFFTQLLKPVGLIAVLTTGAVLFFSFSLLNKDKKEQQTSKTQLAQQQPTMSPKENQFAEQNTTAIGDTLPYRDAIDPNKIPSSNSPALTESPTQLQEATMAKNTTFDGGGTIPFSIDKSTNLNARNLGGSTMPIQTQQMRISQNAKSSTSTVVDFEAENTGEGNPYTVKYSYEMNKTADGHTEIELKAFMDPMDMNFSDRIKLTSDAQMVIMPKGLEVGDELNDAEGTFVMTIPGVPDFKKKYEVSLLNRKITEVSTKTINGKKYNAYKHTYYYLNKSYFNGKLDGTKYHNVSEWYVESIGIIDQERSGTNERGERKEIIKSKSQF